VLPSDTLDCKFAQIYILDSHAASLRRQSLGKGALSINYLLPLHDMLLQRNALVRSFVFSARQCEDWRISIPSVSAHCGDDIGDVLGILCSAGHSRLTTVQCRGDASQLMILDDLNPYYQPMHYVLLFPYGDSQWGTHLQLRPKVAGVRTERERTVKKPQTSLSLSDFMLFYLQRRNAFTPHRFGKLFQSWVVDSFLQLENHRLMFIRGNQTKLRAEDYRVVQREAHILPAAQIGRPYILPSSFVGSQRYWNELYRDAMMLPLHFGGSVDYFITSECPYELNIITLPMLNYPTVTCNPEWPEITSGITGVVPGGANHPDLCCRVFHQKMCALFHDLLQNHVLGVVEAYTWVVEFQRRGLPHLHMLLFVRKEDKPITPAKIDASVSACFPDAADADYFAAVTKHMVHPPCGHENPKAYCMNGDMCRFKYPKELQDDTSLSVDGYAHYKRPFGRTVQLTATRLVDNSVVVPHNRYLLCKYDCHLNVEASASIASVKYLFGYCHKGTPRALATITSNDEIKAFAEGRETSAADALWRFIGFPFHDQTPSVVRLHVHMPGQHDVMFHADDTAEELHAKASTVRVTKLDAWFALNQHCASARQFKYAEIPKFFTWNTADRCWLPRKKACTMLGRIYEVPITDLELTGLRLLLLHVRGAQSFDDLRIVDGFLYTTFQDAARAMGLMDNSLEYWNAMYDANGYVTPARLRDLFVTILTACFPTRPDELFEDFWTFMTDDWTGDDRRNQLLHHVLQVTGRSAQQLGLPEPAHHVSLSLLERCYSWDPDAVRTQAAKLASMLNAEQLIAFETIMKTVERGDTSQPNTFMLQAPAGTGKTTVIECILNAARARGMLLLPVASSGLAASLLSRARTGHSTFRIPIDVDEDGLCRPTTAEKEVFRNAKGATRHACVPPSTVTIQQDSSGTKRLKFTNSGLMLWIECCATCVTTPTCRSLARCFYFRAIGHNCYQFIRSVSIQYVTASKRHRGGPALGPYR
jgi:hypothetical protein